MSPPGLAGRPERQILGTTQGSSGSLVLAHLHWVFLGGKRDYVTHPAVLRSEGSYSLTLKSGC